MNLHQNDEKIYLIDNNLVRYGEYSNQHKKVYAKKYY